MQRATKTAITPPMRYAHSEPEPAVAMTAGPITRSDAVGVMSETVSATVPMTLRERRSVGS